MPRYLETIDPDAAAERLIAQHGRRARQIIADEIVAAVRAGDLARAKRWDHIGDEVDRQLAV